MLAIIHKVASQQPGWGVMSVWESSPLADVFQNPRWSVDVHKPSSVLGRDKRLWQQSGFILSDANTSEYRSVAEPMLLSTTCFLSLVLHMLCLLPPPILSNRFVRMHEVIRQVQYTSCCSHRPYLRPQLIARFHSYSYLPSQTMLWPWQCARDGGPAVATATQVLL